MTTIPAAEGIAAAPFFVARKPQNALDKGRAVMYKSDGFNEERCEVLTYFERSARTIADRVPPGWRYAPRGAACRNEA